MLIRKKNKILSAAKNAGCDPDGDIVMYKGTLYYVAYFNNYVEKVKGVHYDIPWFIRRKFTGRSYIKGGDNNETTK